MTTKKVIKFSTHTVHNEVYSQTPYRTNPLGESNSRPALDAYRQVGPTQQYPAGQSSTAGPQPVPTPRSSHAVKLGLPLEKGQEYGMTDGEAVVELRASYERFVAQGQNKTTAINSSVTEFNNVHPDYLLLTRGQAEWLLNNHEGFKGYSGYSGTYYPSGFSGYSGSGFSEL